MKLDAHYYAILGFCRGCGFTKENAHKIAYASQYVDDASINHIVIDGDYSGFQHDIIENQAAFFNMATCHTYTRIKTFNYHSMINNTCAFHFIPGVRGKSFPRKLRCFKDSPIAAGLMEEAKQEADLVKLGVVLHAYADLFSHQGFSGLISKVNDIQKATPEGPTPWQWTTAIPRFIRWFRKTKPYQYFDCILDHTIPAYGHGQAMEYPDLPYLTWSYQYDFSDKFSMAYQTTGRIKNTERYTLAFNRIKTFLEEYLQMHPHFKEPSFNFTKFNILFKTLLNQASDKQREENWHCNLIDLGLFEIGDPALKYNKYQWLREAFSNFDRHQFNQRRVNSGRPAPDFSKSNWYQYYLAVKWYKQRFYHYCSQAGLDIPV